MKRASWVVWVVVVSVLLASAWFVFGPKEKLPEDPLKLVPADAYGLVRVRVDRVLASDAFKRLVVERGHATGMQRVEKTCGYNPLSRVREAIIFARPAPDGGLPRIAFVARGELRHDELVECVQKVTGVDRSKLRTEDIEGITTVMSTKGTSRVAFVGREGFMGGDGETVRHVIHLLRGKAPTIESDPLLTSLFREVAQGQDVAGVARIPESLQPELKKVLASEAAFAGLLSPLAEVRALSGNANLDQGQIRGGALLLSSSNAQAAAIAELAKGQLERLLRIPGVSLTPAGSVLRSVQVEARGDRVTLAGAIKVSTASALLELLPALEKLKDALAPEPAAPTGEPRGDAGAPRAAPSPAP